MEDYLDEDPVISTQKYAILSYVLSEKRPMIKVRGSFDSIDQCKARIKKLQNIDSYFHMYVIEIGKWGALLTDEELNDKEISQEFRNEELNNMMKSYKEERDKANDSYERRKVEMKRLAELEGTKRGQEILAGEKEHPLSVKTRLEDTATLLDKLKKDIEEYTQIYQETREKLAEYTEEEIMAAEKQLSKGKFSDYGLGDDPVKYHLE
jgi:hypothetical protein